MKKRIVFAMWAGVLVGLSGCVKNPADESEQRMKDITRQFEEDNKKISLDLEKLFSVGGQPGGIKIGGVIVKENAKLDARITLLVKGGVGKDGVEAQVDPQSQPKLSSSPLFSLSNSVVPPSADPKSGPTAGPAAPEKIDLSAQEKDRSLLAIGCDPKKVEDAAKARELEVVPAPVLKREELHPLSAHTVILCGSLDQAIPTALWISADELILNAVHLTRTEMPSGIVTINTNHLVLMGENRIQAKGIDTALPFLQPPPISLNVLKGISSDEDGKLLLSSIGASYRKAEKK